MNAKPRQFARNVARPRVADVARQIMRNIRTKTRAGRGGEGRMLGSETARRRKEYTYARLRVGGAPRTPRSGSARQMRARAGHADAFFYLKGVQLSATHGAAATAWARARGVPSRRFVSYCRGNEPSSGAATLFIIGKHARQRRLLLRNEGPGNLLGMLPLGARVFRIIKPFKHRACETRELALLLYVYTTYMYVIACHLAMLAWIFVPRIRLHLRVSIHYQR